MSLKNAQKSSKIARLTAARLSAVQAVYQQRSTGQDVAALVREYKDHRLGKSVDGQAMVLPDGVLFEKIVGGALERESDLRAMLDACLKDHSRVNTTDSSVFIEPLLESILLCGAYELMAHHDIDAPVIISDYLDVTHAFYEGGESKLVNGILDNIRKQVRDGA